MKIVQMLPCFAYGDAIGNETVAIDNMLKEEGYETAIYAESCDEKMRASGLANEIREDLSFSNNDIILFHLAISNWWNKKVLDFGAKVIYIYHNVTPAKYFSGPYNPYWIAVQKGIMDVKYLANKVKYCIADSEFNRSELISYGYNCDIRVIPLLIPFEDYKQKPSEEIVQKYSDYEGTKILFTGRVAPNKKHEDIIAVFYEYKKHIDPKARLFLVGSYNPDDKYYKSLKQYASELDCEDDVIFTGHIRFDEILAYYTVSDCFLCLSEHEGFCVPLVEAMCFDMPVIAYDSCAVKGTLGGAGFLLDKKNPLETAFVINRILEDKVLKDTIISNQRERLKDFDYKVIKRQLLEFLKGVISG